MTVIVLPLVVSFIAAILYLALPESMVRPRELARLVFFAAVLVALFGSGHNTIRIGAL